MKALRKQRLCSFLWGWGKWENRPCSIQKRPGISLPDRFFHFPRWKHMPPYSQFLSDSPSQGSSTYPCDRGNSLRRPPVNPWLSSDRASGLRKRQKGQLASSPCQSMAFTRPRQRSEKKTKGTACVVPPVNLWLSPDRASGLRKRQKGQLALSPCQSMAFIGPRQRSEKKTKGTACAVPPVNLRLSSNHAAV